MAHHHLHSRKVDADTHHGRRVAVPQNVRGEVRQLQPSLPQVEDARREPALAAADERVVGLLAVDHAGDRLAQHPRHWLVAVVGLAVDEQRGGVAVLHVVAHAQASDLGQAKAGEEQQQHHVGVEPRLRHVALLDAAHDGQHLILAQCLVSALPHARRLDRRQRVAVDVTARDGQSEQSAGDLQFLAVERLGCHLALALRHVGDEVAVLHLMQRPFIAPHAPEDGEVLAVVVERVWSRAGLAQLGQQQRARLADGQDRGGLAAPFRTQLVEAARVGAGFVGRVEGRAVVAPAVHPQHGTEAAPVTTNVAGQPRAVLFHSGRVPTMGAKNQEDAGEQAVGARSPACDTGRGTPNAKGANGLRTAVRREATASPLTPSETVGFGPEGAKKGASYCATGCTTPPAAVVVAGDAMCWDCAEDMGAV